MDKLKNDLDHLGTKLNSVKETAEQIFDDDVTETFKDIKLSIAAGLMKSISMLSISYTTLFFARKLRKFLN